MRLFLLMCIIHSWAIPSSTHTQSIFSAEGSQLQCYLQAECPNALSLLPVAAESYSDCLVQCKADERCQWFTFYLDIQICKLLTSCPDGPTAECQQGDCYSGQSACDYPQTIFVCDRKGLWCEGPEVSFWITKDLEDCKDYCRQTEQCAWYNYDCNTQVCLLTSSCNGNDTITDCPTCTAGQQECLLEQVQDVGMNKLMVVGGNEDGSSVRQNVEVIDLSGNKSIMCPQLQEGPVSYGAVGAFIKGNAMVCAGPRDPNACYIYSNKTDTWERMPGSLIYHNYRRAAVVLDNAQWWLTGGWLDGDMGQSTTEILIVGDDVGDAINSVKSVRMPGNTYLHMLLRFNETAIIYLGGYGGSHRGVSVFDLPSQRWTQLPNMPSSLGDKAQPVAGVATFPDGSRQLVVAGGQYWTPGSASTIIFDFATNEWRAAANGNLPLISTIVYAASVQYGETFLVVGGKSDGDYLDTIFEFDPAHEEWIMRETFLNEKKYDVAAFLVPDDYVKCV